MATGSGGAFATLTHARLRASQGDVGGAVRILRVVLEAQPDHREARLFLLELEDRVPITYREATATPAQAAGPSGRVDSGAGARGPLEGGRDSARLSRWLERIRRNRGERRVR